MAFKDSRISENESYLIFTLCNASRYVYAFYVSLFMKFISNTVCLNFPINGLPVSVHWKMHASIENKNEQIRYYGTILIFEQSL